MHLNYYLTFRLSAIAVFRQLSLCFCQAFACLDPLTLHRQLSSLSFLDRAVVQSFHLFDHVFIVSVFVQHCLFHQTV